jgi:hypothetical protein
MSARAGESEHTQTGRVLVAEVDPICGRRSDVKRVSNAVARVGFFLVLAAFPFY